MQILSETVHNSEYLIMSSLLIIFALLFGIMSLMLLWELISTRSLSSNEVLGVIATGLMTTMLSVGAYSVATEGARVSYKATITDFNVVFEQGYRIIEQNGEIYTLERDK